MSNYNKYLKYKKKYSDLKQTGGTIINNLIKIIKKSIDKNTFKLDEPVEPSIIYEAVLYLKKSVLFRVNDNVNVINNSTIYNVFSNMDNTFRYIQLKLPTLTLTDATLLTPPVPITFEFSNFYLCRYMPLLNELINGINQDVYWLVELKSTPNVSKIYIPVIFARL